MKKLFILSVLFGLILCNSVFSSEEGADRYPYILKITTGSLISGEDLRYYLNSDKVIVFGKMKRQDIPKELFFYELTDTEQERMNNFLSSFPLDRLNNAYVPQHPIHDGYYFNFSFKLKGKTHRTITIANTYQQDLMDLVLEINLFLPEQFKLYSNWHYPDEVLKNPVSKDVAEYFLKSDSSENRLQRNKFIFLVEEDNGPSSKCKKPCPIWESKVFCFSKKVQWCPGEAPTEPGQ